MKKEWENPGRLPLKLVVNVAAHLLNENDYETAARRAVELVRECRYQLLLAGDEYVDKKETDRWEGEQKSRATVPCEKALQEICGGETIPDAFRRYRVWRTKQLSGPVYVQQNIPPYPLRAVVEASLTGKPQPPRPPDPPKPQPTYRSKEEVEKIIKDELEEMRRDGVSPNTIVELRASYLRDNPRHRAKPRKNSLAKHSPP